MIPSFNTDKHMPQNGLSGGRLHLLLAQKNVPQLLAARAIYSFSLALLVFASLGSLALILVTSFFADCLGRKRFLVILSLLTTAGALTSLSRGGGAVGTGEVGILHPAEQGLLSASVTDRQRNTAFAALAIVGTLGGAAGAAVAGLSGLLQASFHLTVLASFRPLLLLAALGGLALVQVIVPIQEPRIARSPHAPPISRRNVGLIGPAFRKKPMSPQNG